MAEYAISAEPRSVIGKKVKHVRLAGKTPGVVYGAGSESVAVELVTSELAALFRAGGKNEQIALTVNGKTQTVVVKELQRHITRGDLVHVDFQIVS